MKPCILTWKGSNLGSFFWDSGYPIVAGSTKKLRQGTEIWALVDPGLWLVAYYEAALFFVHMGAVWLIGEIKNMSEKAPSDGWEIYVGPLKKSKPININTHLARLDLNEIDTSDWTHQKGVK